MEYDNILRHIREFGPFQRRVYFTLVLVTLPHTFNTMGYVFWAARLEHWCHVDRPSDLVNISEELWKHWTIPVKVGASGNLQYDSCSYFAYWDNYTTHNYISQFVQNESMDGTSISYHLNWTGADKDQVKACQSWDYDTQQYKSSIVTKYSLVCDRQWLISMTQSVYLACRMFGTVGAGLLSDKFGRRPILLLSVLFEFITSFGLAFAPDIFMFMALRGTTAALSTAAMQCAYITVLELLVPSRRVFAGTGMWLGWATSYMLTPLLAYFIRNHFTLMVTISMFSTVAIPFYCVVPESPRWLLAKERQTEALSIIKRMARVNGHTFLEDDAFGTFLEVDQKVIENNTTIRDLVRNFYVWKITLIQCFIWFTFGFAYYGLSLSPHNLGGNDYVNVFISGAVEVPAYLLVYVTYVKFGRQWPLALLTLLAGLSLLFIILVPTELHAAITTLATVGKFAVTSTFGMVFIYTVELYPTSIRGFTLGICNTAARIGSALAPFTTDLSVYYPGAPYLVFGIMALVASVLVLTLPETKGISLPQTLEDGIHLAKQPNAFARCRGLCSKKTSEKRYFEENDESSL